MDYPGVSLYPAFGKVNMAEEFQEQAQPPLDLKRYVNLLRRRRWYVIVPLFTVWLAVWGVSWVMHSVYRSSTLILVLQPSVSPNILGTSPSTDLQDRLDSIEQQIKSRTRLLHIIDRLNLYPKERARHVSDDDLVAKMVKDLNIVLVRAPGKDELTSFNISFDSENPQVAQEVTNELSNILISENLEIGQMNAENTVKFLDTQLEDARKKLAIQDENLRKFKDRYAGELPTQTQSNLQILTGLQNQLQAEQDALGRAKEHNVYLESLSNSLKTAGGTTKAVEVNVPGTAMLDQQLAQLREKLSDLSSRYTPQHPDVRKVKEQIAETERARQQLIQDLKTKGPDAVAAGGGGDYGGRTMTPLMEADSQLKANRAEIENHQRSIVQLIENISQYQGRLNSAPAREQELADLNRDYETSQKYYDTLLAQKNQAGLAANLGKSQEGLQFRIQDPPSLPTKPFSPKRFLFSLGGLVGGLALGLVAAVGAEYLDDRIYEEDDFKKIIPADVIAEIPPLPTAEEEKTRRGRLRLEWVAVSMIGMITLVGFAYSFLRG
jgi:succinoglycan biosynthesis transport protein ExoP